MDVKPGPTRIAADCTYHITMPDIPYLWMLCKSTIERTHALHVCVVKNNSFKHSLTSRVECKIILRMLHHSREYLQTFFDSSTYSLHYLLLQPFLHHL
jgi:hypothetical protein